jgi:WD40 repeat protein
MPTNSYSTTRAADAQYFSWPRADADQFPPLLGAKTENRTPDPSVEAHLLMSVFWVLTSGLLFAQDTSTDLTFWKDVRPVFQKHCTICHSVKNKEKKDIAGGLALSHFEAFMRDPKEPLVVPGQSSASRLYQLLITEDEEARMPKDADPLSSEAIELIKRWIDMGAAEGTRPPQTSEAAPPAEKIQRPASLLRSLDVVFPCQATLSPDAAKALNSTPAPPGSLELAVRVGPLPSVTALAFQGDPAQLVVGSYGSIAVWELPSARVVQSIDFVGAVHCTAVSPDGSLLAVGGGLPARSGQVVIYDTKTWTTAATLPDHGDVVYDAAFSPDGKWLATASFDKTVKVWTTADGKPVETLRGHSDFVYSVAFTPDGKRLLSSSKDRSIKVFSTENWQSERTLTGHNEDVLSLAVSADSYNAVSAGKEPQLRWWIIENGQNNRVMTGHSGTVSELAFSRDGKRIASVGQDKTVRIWDGADGKAIRSITGATEWLYSVALSPDARFVAAGSWDGLVRIWEAETGRLLATLASPLGPNPANPQWLAMTPEGYYYASEDLDALVQWHAGDQPVAGEILATTLRQPEMVKKALSGEPLEPVKFPSP